MKKISWLVIVLLLFGPFTVESREIKVLYGDLPPYMFVKDGKPAGFYYELLQEMKKELKDIDFTYRYLPVNRMIYLTQRDPGTMCLGLTRNEKRENLYKWVGPSIPRRVCAYRLKSNSHFRLRTKEDFQKYSFGVGLGFAAIQDLLKHGASMENIDQVSNDSVNIKKLVMGRFDFYASIDVVAIHYAKLNGVNWNDIHCEYVLNDKYSLYYVFNKATADSLVEEFQQALDKVKESGRWKKLIDVYYGT